MRSPSPVERLIHRLSLCLCCIAAMCQPPHAAAQPPNAVPPADARLLAAGLGDLAQQSLREPQPNHPQRLYVARTLLEEAVRLDPASAELWRLHIEALELAGDQAALRTALAQYLKLEPADDVAQLRLIDLLAAEQHTAEQRLTVYTRLVEGAAATRFSPALRSRVALRAANLYGEAGQIDGYGRMLKLAVQLDEAHQAAAVEAYRFLQQRGAGEVELAQALFNVVAAEPSDGDAHAEVATLLLHCGQYDQAVAWFESASRLWGHQGLPDPAQVLQAAHDWALALWGAGRHDDALAFIHSFIVGAAPANPQVQAPPIPGAPAGLQMIAAAVYQSAGRNEAAANAFAQLSATLKVRHDAEPDNLELLVDRAWSHLLLNQSLDQVQPMLAKLQQALGETDPVVTRLRGWLHLRTGNQAEAQADLARCAEVDALCRLGLALAQPPEAQARRTELLAQVFRQGPGTMAGVLAALHLQDGAAPAPGGRVVGGGAARPQPSQACIAIARLAAQLPAELRAIGTPSSRLLMLRLKPLAETVDFAEPVEFQLQLLNTSATPWSVGPGGTLPAQVMLRVRASHGDSETVALQPVNLHRRLRLNPGQSVAARVRVDIGEIAQALRRRPTEPVKVSVVAVLNPRLGLDGQVIAGLMGTEVIATAVQRLPRAVTEQTVDQALARLDEPDRSAVMASIAWLASLTASPDQLDDASRRRIAEGLHSRWPAWTPIEQAWLMLHLPPPSADDAQLHARLTDAAVNSDQPLVHFVMLAKMVTAGLPPDSPVLTAALRRPLGPIQRFAEAVRETLMLAPSDVP